MDEKDSDMVRLWQEMGASTGSMIGRFIGLSAQMSLNMFNNYVLMPAQNEQTANEDSNSNSGLRSKTWGEMGQQFGKSIGEFIGAGMDAVVKTAESNVINPLEDSEKKSHEQKE